MGVVEAGWLAARATADDAARASTVQTLLPALVDHLRSTGAHRVRVIDVGAGSGANQRWLSPRLPLDQHWIHLDADPSILDHSHGLSADTEFVVAGVTAVADLITDEPVMITCAAVLDVLTRTDLSYLVDLIIEHRLPALFSLSVTGTMAIEPADDLDQVLLEAFNAHQRRGGRAGPDAVDLVHAQLEPHGMAVREVPTPWVIDRASQPDFVRSFLVERVAASVEQDPSLRDAAAAWLPRRLGQLDDDLGFQLTVGHLDLLALPAPS